MVDAYLSGKKLTAKRENDEKAVVPYKKELNVDMLPMH